MSALPAAPAAPDLPHHRSRRRRALLWGALVSLLLVAQSLLVWLTVDYESNRAQEQVETVSASVAADIRQAMSRDLQNLQALLWNDPPLDQWRIDAAEMLRTHREIVRIEQRNLDQRILAAVESPFQGAMFTRIRREDMDIDTEVACTAARRQASPALSRSYFVPLPGGLGLEVIDACLPIHRAGHLVGFMAATFALQNVLTEAVAADVLRGHELSFVEGDGTRLARVGLTRGAGIYVSERLIDLPGITLQMRLDSAAGSPRLIPNLAVALVLGLSLALGAVVLLLVHDVRKRAQAERALAESLAFRKAMEDSLVTGLRARDLQGHITYVNPAFCQMVGFSADEVIGKVPPPYWPPELADEYGRRQAIRLGAVRPTEEVRQTAREGFETTFMRKNGERFAVLIFEAPLVDGTGEHTGWMSAVLDVSDQRRIEEISRQQQERLQATARLATVGEMASLLSHELNQPLAAIASYAAGSLNLMQSGAHDRETVALLQQAAERIAEQAERAGRVIKSVHNFVRRRDQTHEAVRCDALIEAVLPLVRLQARKSGTRVELDMQAPVPRVVCDRTMVEQVLLNLTRNGIQAMESHTPPAQRELLIRVRQTHARWVTISVIDHGPGVPPEVAQQLFTPFFTTRSEGMGLGLSLCRTVIEQHGGALDFVTLPSEDAAGSDASKGTGATTEFRFTLPADSAERRPPHAPAEPHGADVAPSTP
ncbi:two-component system, LuxR family, sensor histidine kinase DctS [Burkholderiaceae bacterium]|nr:two-component system, LuxR family, sensor histidine kinase DctS [Burkholderiaceae bacterium]